MAAAGVIQGGQRLTSTDLFQQTGYEASNWYGVGIPKNTPADIVDKLNKEINAGLADPKIKARLAVLGVTPLVVSPADFGRLIAEETGKWGKVIRALNIKAD